MFRTASRFCLAAALAFAPAAARALEPGQPLPACALQTLAGHAPVALDQLKGRVVLVDFWASWCAPCARAFPFLNQLQQDYAERGLTVLGVNVDENPADAATFLQKRPVDFPLASGADGVCPGAFGVAGMPSSYLVDRNGVVRRVFVGFRDDEADQVRAAVEALLAEPAPAAP